MSEANARIWSYAEEEHAENLDGDCETPEEAILEAHAEYNGDAFWLYECRRCHVSEFVPSADSILDMMRESACDLVGDVAEEFPDVSKAAEKELEELLDAWAEKHCEAPFWTSDGCGKSEKIAADDPRRFPVDGK